MVGANPIVLVGTKMDLLPAGAPPKDVSGGERAGARGRCARARRRTRAGRRAEAARRVCMCAVLQPGREKWGACSCARRRPGLEPMNQTCRFRREVPEKCVKHGPPTPAYPLERAPAPVPQVSQWLADSAAAKRLNVASVHLVSSHTGEGEASRPPWHPRSRRPLRRACLGFWLPRRWCRPCARRGAPAPAQRLAP
jgi:hypothetical protein